MSQFLKYSLFALTLTLGTSTLAYARGDHHERGGNNQDRDGNCDNTAPEVDPGMAMGGLTLLGGTIAVARARRRN